MWYLVILLLAKKKNPSKAYEPAGRKSCLNLPWQKKKMNVKAKCFSSPVWEGFLLRILNSALPRLWCAGAVVRCLVGVRVLRPLSLPPSCHHRMNFHCSCRWILVLCWYQLLLSEGQQIAEDLLKEWDVIVISGCKSKVIWGATFQTLIFFVLISLSELWCYFVCTCCSRGTIFVFPLHWNISTKLTCFFFWSAQCNIMRISKGH